MLKLIMKKVILIFNDVIDNLSKKLIRRHPHVFEKDSNTKSKKQIEKNWVNIKQQERIAKGNIGMLEDIPKALSCNDKITEVTKKSLRKWL